MKNALGALDAADRLKKEEIGEGDGDGDGRSSNIDFHGSFSEEDEEGLGTLFGVKKDPGRGDDEEGGVVVNMGGSGRWRRF